MSKPDEKLLLVGVTCYRATSEVLLLLWIHYVVYLKYHLRFTLTGCCVTVYDMKMQCSETQDFFFLMDETKEYLSLALRPSSSSSSGHVAPHYWETGKTLSA